VVVARNPPIRVSQQIVDLFDMSFDCCGMNRTAIAVEIGDNSSEATPMSPAALMRSTIAALSCGSRTPKRMVPIV
jgi:hypothetical protein